jgi:two-component system, cell cycle sensor histidine kinase and response regulator CckA
MLGKAGFTVLEAADGPEAVELLRSKAARIDLLLLDITISGCSSHEVLSEAVEGWPQMKIILTSAYSEEMAKASLTAPQVSGFIRKPFQFRTLLSTLRNALSS